MKKGELFVGVLLMTTFCFFTVARAAEKTIRIASAFEPKHILCQAAIGGRRF
jgi:hypothetical protein